MLRFVCAAVLLLCLAGNALAQVNTENFRKQGERAGLHGGVELHFANRTGNTDLLAAGFGLNLGYRIDPHALLLVGKMDVGSTRQETSINKGFLHLRDTADITPIMAWEGFVQHEYDKFSRLDARTLVGTGPRFTLHQSKRGSVHLGVAYMAERERIHQQGGGRVVHRTSSHLALSGTVGQVTLGNTVYLQPRWGAWDDIRVLEELTAKVALGGALSLKIGFTLRYDGEPPVGVKATDTALTNRLAWDF